jgi:hypothetical protein
LCGGTSGTSATGASGAASASARATTGAADADIPHSLIQFSRFEVLAEERRGEAITGRGLRGRHGWCIRSGLTSRSKPNQCQTHKSRRHRQFSHTHVVRESH